MRKVFLNLSDRKNNNKTVRVDPFAIQVMHDEAKGVHLVMKSGYQVSCRETAEEIGKLFAELNRRESACESAIENVIENVTSIGGMEDEDKLVLSFGGEHGAAHVHLTREQVGDMVAKFQEYLSQEAGEKEEAQTEDAPVEAAEGEETQA